MNFAYIDSSIKPRFFMKKVKKFTIDSENKLYIFPSLKKQSRLISKLNLKIIDENTEYFYKDFVYTKAIIQTLKEKNISNVTFCFDNPANYIYLMENMFKNNISFSITDCSGSENIVEYFLEKFGHPVRTLNSVKIGLLVYFGGEIPYYKKNVSFLDFNGCFQGEKIIIDEYLIKNKSFPIKITSLALLDAAAKLLDIDKSDIIIKFCIINKKEE